MLRAMVGRFLSLACLTIALAGDDLPPAKQRSLLQQHDQRSGVDTRVPDSPTSEIDSIDEDDDKKPPEQLQTDWYSEEAGQSPYPDPDAVAQAATPAKLPAPPPPPPVSRPTPAASPPAETAGSPEASKTKEALKEEVDKGAASAKAMKSGVDNLKEDGESMTKVQLQLESENAKLMRSLNHAAELAKKCAADLENRKSELAEKKNTRDAEREKMDKAQRHHDSLADELAKVNKEIELLNGQVGGLKSDLLSGQERYSELVKEEGGLKRELEELKEASESRLAGLQEELKEATTTLSDAKTEATTLQKTYDDASSQADDLKSDIDKLRKHLEAARKAADTLKVYASEAAMMGGDEEAPLPTSS